MVRATIATRRKARLRTLLSAADAQLLEEAAVVFGLPKAEVVRRLIRASLQAGPALSAENMRVVAELAAQVRMVGRNLAQVLKAMHQGRAVGMGETEPVWRGLCEAIAFINDELTDMTLGHGLKLRRRAGLAVADPEGMDAEVAA
ncbi:MAG: hypothetical protein ACKVON_11035 [Beijerinckiaceae bacterium]